MQPNHHPNPTMTWGFWLAGGYNIVGTLIFSAFFTNTLLTSLDPMLFSWFGLVAIILWGFAYLSVAKSYAAVPYLVAVFVVEKLLYATMWLMWLLKNGGTLPALFSTSPLTATFYVLYGAGDFAFALFFLWVVVQVWPKRATV
jgi:hypothetical protein